MFLWKKIFSLIIKLYKEKEEKLSYAPVSNGLIYLAKQQLCEFLPDSCAAKECRHGKHRDVMIALSN